MQVLHCLKYMLKFCIIPHSKIRFAALKPTMVLISEPAQKEITLLFKVSKPYTNVRFRATLCQYLDVMKTSLGASGPQSLLKLLPQTPSIRSTHKSFNDVFRSSRLATIQNISSQDPSFYTRHRQHHPKHQVISSFNAAHRWGDWGLKRPFPPVKAAHIIVPEFATQERQTPY